MEVSLTEGRAAKDKEPAEGQGWWWGLNVLHLRFGEPGQISGHVS
jgi:hypothetical protein